MNNSADTEGAAAEKVKQFLLKDGWCPKAGGDWIKGRLTLNQERFNQIVRQEIRCG